MDREQDDVAQFLPDPVAFPLTNKEAPEPLLADIGLDRRGIAALPADGERARVEIGAEDLDRGPGVATACLLEKQHRDGVGLLAGRAATDPDADGIGGSPAFESWRAQIFGAY